MKNARKQKLTMAEYQERSRRCKRMIRMLEEAETNPELDNALKQVEMLYTLVKTEKEQ